MEQTQAHVPGWYLELYYANYTLKIIHLFNLTNTFYDSFHHICHRIPIWNRSSVVIVNPVVNTNFKSPVFTEPKTHERKKQTSHIFEVGFVLTLEVSSTSSIHLFYFKKLVQQRPTDLTSFCMQFEKEDLGYCGKLSGVWEWVVCWKRKGEKGEYQSWKTEMNIGQLPVNPTLPHSGKLPAVTHVTFFQTACKMMSCRCVVAGPVSANKTNV